MPDSENEIFCESLYVAQKASENIETVARRKRACEAASLMAAAKLKRRPSYL